ncbi:hypothetical protein Airi01_083020 [Actinoallomurus iriomotensis]|uniref:Uncharacterized protein n=1 Tax=Actinoallomurus iriomotensis TaxID=478107 RepID=A0A9W6RU91_9ACTN|nr:hypothetical protein Airi01_083020 [Actinoallomurus iriomotensis]
MNRMPSRIIHCRPVEIRYAAMLTLVSNGSSSVSMVDMPLGGGNCGGAAMATLSSGTGGGAIRAGRWKAILLIGSGCL